MSAVGHVGDHADDALAGGALAGVARDQQLHNRIVYVPERKGQMVRELGLMLMSCIHDQIRTYTRSSITRSWQNGRGERTRSGTVLLVPKKIT